MLSKPAYTRAFPTATLLAAALMLPSLPGMAQQQVSSGNALDANQQVGSGGVNTNAAQIDFQRRNLLITGQVNDGRQFRGDVDYGAAGAFGGSIGSDDLFRFRADSFGTNRSFAPPLPGNPNGQAVIYNDYFSPQAGMIQPGVTRTVISPDGSRATTVRQNPGNIYNPDLLSIPSADRPYISPADAYVQNPANLGGFQSLTGDALRVEANPLFGVRPAPTMPGAAQPTAPGQPQRDEARFGDRAPENLIQARIDPLSPGSAAQGRLDGSIQPGQSGATINPDAGDVPAVAGLIQPQPGTLGSNPTNTPRNLPGSLPTSVNTPSPTQQIGQRLGPAAIVGQTNRGTGGDDQRLQRLGEAIFSPDQLARADEESIQENAYLSLLTRIREQAEQRVDQRLNNDENADNADARRDALPRPAWMRSIEDPSEEAIKQAEDRRLNTLARLLQIERENQQQRREGGVVPQWRSTFEPAPAPGNAPENASGNVDPNTGEARGNQPVADVGVTRSDTLQSLINQLSYDLPRVETLQGNRATRINETFAQAEDALAKGNYFNAEAMYRQLILDAPDNPLARVGQVHSEMGAGMVRSAAFHLRQLFEKHPELISTRYAQNLLPPADRLQWLQGELQKTIGAQEQSSLEPGLLLAYLGWQVESRQLVRYGLAVAQEAAPADPLLNVLRSVWLGEEK